MFLRKLGLETLQGHMKPSADYKEEVLDQSSTPLMISPNWI